MLSLPYVPYGSGLSSTFAHFSSELYFGEEEMVIRPHIWVLRHLPEICSPETFDDFIFFSLLQRARCLSTAILAV